MQITNSVARSYIIDHQLPTPQKGKTGTLAVIEKLGYVQIDTISVIARAHHHILWTRVPNYQPLFLQTLVENDKKVYDYWAHAASFLPMQDYQFSLYRKMEQSKSSKHWYEKNPKNMAFVLDQIKANGPLMSKDLTKGDFIKTHAWGVPPVKQALMHLFMDGQIMVVGRQGFQKIYDLPERFLPAAVNTELPSRKEYIEHIIRRDIHSHGLIKTKSIGHLLKISIKEKQVVIDEMIQTGELIPVQIKGLALNTYYAFKEKIEGYQPKRSTKKFHILSPFDNLVILRKRVAEIFDFKYLLECYVTEKKRKVGYFSLPLLYGTNFVGQADFKTDRKTKILWIRNLVWEPSLKKTDHLYVPFWKKLKDFMLFNGCVEVKTELTDKHLLELIKNQ